MADDARFGPRKRANDQRSLACRIAVRRELLQAAKMLRAKARIDEKVLGHAARTVGMFCAAGLLEARAKRISV